MQVVVRRSELTLASDEVVHVVATHERDAEVAEDASMAVLSLAPSAVVVSGAPALRPSPTEETMPSPPHREPSGDFTNLAMVAMLFSRDQPAQPPVQPQLRPFELPTLVTGWRETYKQQIVSGEASKRIEAVFPEYSQLNSVYELDNYIVMHGADGTKWPAQAKQRKVELDRCWGYVNGVRAKAAALLRGGLPADPTADSVWPTRIQPYQPAG